MAPLLYQSGEAALAWWRIRDSTLAGTPTGALLHDAYRHLRLAARAHERNIKHVFALLRDEGIEPVLVKGWASARRYPDSALRPYGDIDLCVRPDQFVHAAAVLRHVRSAAGPFVDLHDGFASIGSEQRGRKARSNRQAARISAASDWDERFSRSRLVSLADDQAPDQIRILSDEDHLRITCLHLLQSGGWRPLWLIDVAVALETPGADFDWTVCIGGEARQAEWIVGTISLADELLIRKKRSEINSEGSREFAGSCPAWLTAAVLRHWGRARPVNQRAMQLGQLLRGGLSVAEVIEELYARWDNPVRATVNLRGRFNNWPRLPYQLGEALCRLPELPRRLLGYSVDRPS